MCLAAPASVAAAVAVVIVRPSISQSAVLLVWSVCQSVYERVSPGAVFVDVLRVFHIFREADLT